MKKFKLQPQAKKAFVGFGSAFTIIVLIDHIVDCFQHQLSDAGQTFMGIMGILVVMGISTVATMYVLKKD